MVATVGSTTTNQAIAGGGSAVGLQAQLDRCTKQLGDWVSCSSGKTQQGKEIIQALQEKISSIKTQIQAANTAKSQTRADGASGNQTENATANTAVTGITSIHSLPATGLHTVLGILGTRFNATA